MAGKAVTYDGIRKKTIRDMKKINTYKPEYEPIIDIYSELREQYSTLTQRYIDSDYECESYTGQGGAKKAPIVATLESLRKDILLYSDRLKLNPKSFTEDSPKGKKKVSKLGEALSSLEK